MRESFELYKVYLYDKTFGASAAFSSAQSQDPSSRKMVKSIILFLQQLKHVRSACSGQVRAFAADEWEHACP